MKVHHNTRSHSTLTSLVELFFLHMHHNESKLTNPVCSRTFCQVFYPSIDRNGIADPGSVDGTLSPPANQTTACRNGNMPNDVQT